MLQGNALYTSIKSAILKSQHCNRNFDLTQNLPEEDIDLFKIAISQCPSKQNICFYGVHFILNREIIEKIYKNTKGFGIDPKNYQTNSQTLANLLVVFEEAEIVNGDKFHKHRNEQTKALAKNALNKEDAQTLKRDRDQTVGIAAGYLNLTASLLGYVTGYVTGCCACFDSHNIKSILGTDKQPLLLMGIGFKDLSRNRREHHLNKNFIFPSFKKQTIPINIIKDSF